MPAVSELFKTYHDFAAADLEDIYGERLKKAYHLKVNHLKSGVWLNESSPESGIQFSWQNLPWDAQLSPVNAIVSGDFDGNGQLELILAQNHYTNQIETGLWRGTPGCHLEWAGNRFDVIPHIQSGILMPNDTKALITIDSDGDGQQDILAGQNNDSLLLFRNTK